MKFRVLGPLSIESGGSPIVINRALERKLLAVLLTRADSSIANDSLIELLWLDELPAKPEAALQTAVSRLRKALDAEHEDHGIRTGQGFYTLELGSNELDAHAFEARVAQCRDNLPAEAAIMLRAALAMWNGPAYADFRFDDFAQSEIIRLRELQIDAQQMLFAAELDLGRHAQVIGEIQAAVTADPLHEQLWSHLMLALYRSGRQAAALRAFQQAGRILREELGIEPSPALCHLEERILRQDPSLDGAALSIGGRAAARRPVLPSPVAPIVGRSDEVAQVLELTTTHRLVSIVGPPGVGKSRLALEVARAGQGRFSDGAVWVALDRDAEPPPVADALAMLLDLEPGAGSARARLLDWAHRRDQLLILDGCEAASPGLGDLVSDLLECSPGLHVLVSSRERLGVAAESVLWLKPLAVPQEVSRDVFDSPAVALFLSRAGDHSGGFDPASADPEVLRQIVTGVDGLPLGIELAASRVAETSLRAIATDLEREAPGATRRKAGPPHGLDAAIESSWDRLSGSAQRVLAGLSVMKGPWTLEMAVDVIGEKFVTERVATLIHELADKSMISPVIRPGPDSEAAFVLLASIRRYAQRQLDKMGMSDEIARRHAHAAAFGAARALESLQGASARWARITFPDRIPDALAAHSWLLSNEPEQAVSMGIDLAWFALRSDRPTLGEQVLIHGIEAAKPTGRALAMTQLLLGFFRMDNVDLGAENVRFGYPSNGWRNWQRVQPDREARLRASAASLMEATELFRELGAQHEAALACVVRGNLGAAWGDLDLAQRLGSEALGVLEGTPDEVSARVLLANVALAVSNDDLAEQQLSRADRVAVPTEPTMNVLILDTYARLARANRRPADAFHYFERALVEHAEPGDLRATAALLHVEMGFLAAQLRDFDTALAAFGRGLEVGRQQGIPRIDGMVRAGQAKLEVIRGDLEAGEDYLDAAFGEFRRLGDTDGQAQVLGARAKLELMRDASDRSLAFALRGVAAASREPMPVGSAHALEAVATVSLDTGDGRSAARFYGAAAGQRRLVRLPYEAGDPAADLGDRIVADLGQAVADDLVASGATLDLAAALGEAAEFRNW